MFASVTSHRPVRQLSHVIRPSLHGVGLSILVSGLHLSCLQLQQLTASFGPCQAISWWPCDPLVDMWEQSRLAHSNIRRDATLATGSGTACSPACALGLSTSSNMQPQKDQVHSSAHQQHCTAVSTTNLRQLLSCPWAVNLPATG